MALKKEGTSTMEYLGCTGQHLKDWILFCFEDDMAMENHGDVWHVDHVIPVSTFDLESEDQVIMCFNWQNLSPLKAEINLSKNNRLIRDQISRHFQRLEDFHTEKGSTMDPEMRELFARHLDAGTSR